MAQTKSDVFYRRIMGVETEYGAQARTPTTDRPIGVDELGRVMFDPVKDEYGSTNVFLPNSSRLYLDVGSHPEIATAECDHALQLLHHVRAGDRIVDDLARRAEEALSGRLHHPISVFQLKNNVDSAGNSYGSHENYLISRELVLKELGTSLLPFLITRQLVCGAGSITPTTSTDPGRFLLSQRAHHVWEGVSSATTRSRPIINTRDEPHADSSRYRRMHIILGDSNMADSSFLLRIVSTQLVLEMLESGFYVPEWELHDPMSDVRTIAGDISGKTPLELSAGGTVTALEIQRAIADKAAEWLHHRPADAVVHRLVQLWRELLDALDAGDVDRLARDVDWAIKLRLLRSYQQRLGVSAEDFSHPKLRHIDLAYHDIREGRGLFSLLETKGAVKRWATEEEIAGATVTPPTTTRAVLRGAFLEAARDAVLRAREAGVEAPTTIVDWTRLKLNSYGTIDARTVELSDPIATTDADAEVLIALLGNLPGSDAEPSHAD